MICAYYGYKRRENWLKKYFRTKKSFGYGLRAYKEKKDEKMALRA